MTLPFWSPRVAGGKAFHPVATGYLHEVAAPVVGSGYFSHLRQIELAVSWQIQKTLQLDAHICTIRKTKKTIYLLGTNGLVV